jgi:hypothetical protein
MQVRALKNAGAEHIWTEQMSGGRDDRPALAELLAAAATGDVLMVWRLDCLGRFLPHLLTVAADLDARGIELRSLTEAIDTTAGVGWSFTSSPRSLNLRTRTSGRNAPPPGSPQPEQPGAAPAGRNCPSPPSPPYAPSTLRAPLERISPDPWVFHDPASTAPCPETPDCPEHVQINAARPRRRSVGKARGDAGCITAAPILGVQLARAPSRGRIAEVCSPPARPV